MLHVVLHPGFLPFGFPLGSGQSNQACTTKVVAMRSLTEITE